MTKSNIAWAGGVWYDPAFLPDLTLPDSQTEKLIADLCDGMWEVIIKTYSPAADSFTYKRQANATLHIEYQRKVSEYIFSPNNEYGRIVAIMLQPNWSEVCETRLTREIYTPNVIVDIPSDALEIPLHEAI